MKSGFSEENCRFFPKSFLVKIVKYKGLIITEEHILTFLNEKAKIKQDQAKMTCMNLKEKNEDLLKIQEISEFCDCKSRSTCQEQKFKAILWQFSFPKSESRSIVEITKQSCVFGVLGGEIHASQILPK